MATAKTAKSKRGSIKNASVKNVSISRTSSKTSLSLGEAFSRNKKLLIIGALIILLAAGAFYYRGLFISAIVNGQPVTRGSIIKDLEKQSGQLALDKKITEMLVSQEADKKKVKVSKADIDKEVARISKQFKDQGQDLNQLLTAQGIKKSDFENDIKIQIIVQKILGDQTKVSDKEFQDFLVKNPTVISAEKDQVTAKRNLRMQLEQQKLSQKYQEWIEKLKKNAKIQQFVDYPNL